ncbi:MAG: GDP-mannose 4,6-dehydratase [Candidatus Omnitrophica bacterium]|nr:GDP-mannose 4,6-dehydratase [Candidatus Omnitrophota bacterium]
MNKKVLITGGAGFIGSHLAERLLTEGDYVTVIDNLSTGRTENIAHLKTDKKFSFVHDTIFNYHKIKHLISKCDIVYHLAAAVGVKYIIENPLKSIQINVQGTEIVLELASLYKKKCFFASTSEVYGKNDKPLLKEDDDSIIGPTRIYRWSYACTKALDEFMALSYHKENGLQVVIGRFFNTCGPRQTGKYGMVIPRFVQQAISGEPMTIYGDGRQVRSFTYIDDTIDGMTGLMVNEEANGGIFNVGSHESITILELAEKIKALANSPSEITYIPYDKVYIKGFEDMRYRVPDISKISALTGYYPKVRLDEMLRRIIGYHYSKK